MRELCGSVVGAFQSKAFQISQKIQRFNLLAAFTGHNFLTVKDSIPAQCVDSADVDLR